MESTQDRRERTYFEECKNMVKYGKGFRRGQADHFSGKTALDNVALNYCNAAWSKGYKDGYNYQNFGK